MRAEPPPAMCMQFVERDLAGVAAGGHQQRAVGDAEVDAFLRRLAGEEAVGEAGGKAVAAADAVFDFEVGELTGRRRTCRRAT